METVKLDPIADLKEWPDASVLWHRNYYKAEARFDAIWNQRVEEIQAEIERRCIAKCWYPY